jgi:branched-chain amino acid transport system permease protein
MTSAREWWRRTSSGITRRWDGMPKWVRILLMLAFIAFLYVLPNRGFYEYLNIPIGNYIPLYTTSSDFATVLFDAGYYVLLALGLNVVVGYAGLLDLGFFGFFAVGAYTVALFTSPNSKIFTDYNWLESPWPWLATVPLAIALGLLAGVLLGFPVLRLRGDYLAIVTLGFAEMIRIVAKQNQWIFNGDRGISNVGHPPGTRADGTPIFGVVDARPYYWLILTVIIFVVIAIRNLIRSRVGRAWVSIREDEDAAELMGVNTFKFKLWAFAIGAAVGSFSGALWASKPGFVNSSTFALENSILVLAAVILGGAGSLGGAVLGGFLVVFLPEWLRSVGDIFGLPDWVRPTELRYGIFGAILIIMMIFRPQGIWPNRRRTLELKDRAKEAAPVV